MHENPPVASLGDHKNDIFFLNTNNLSAILYPKKVPKSAKKRQ